MVRGFRRIDLNPLQVWSDISRSKANAYERMGKIGEAIGLEESRRKSDPMRHLESAKGWNERYAMPPVGPMDKAPV